MMLFGQRFKIIHDMAYKRNNIYLLYTQLHLIFLYLSEIKNLVHQAKHTVGITFYYMQLLTYIIRQSLVFSEHIPQDLQSMSAECEVREKYL